MATDLKFDALTEKVTLTGANGYSEWVDLSTLITSMSSCGVISIQNRGVAFDNVTAATLEVACIPYGGTAPTVAAASHGDYVPVAMMWEDLIWMSDVKIYLKTDTDNTTISVTQREDKSKGAI